MSWLHGGVLRCRDLMMGMMMIMGMGVSGNSIGANWGIQATHPLPANIVVQMLKDNGIKKVKLFEADPSAMRALGKSGIEVMVGIPNDLLAYLSTDVSAADNWVTHNLSSYVSSYGVNVRYVAVGNEQFLTTLNGTYNSVTLPALQNIQSALTKAGLSPNVKVTVPLNADVYETSNKLPSGGDFRANIHDLMLQVVKFLSDNSSPITINIYPFISLHDDPSFPTDYAFFDGFSSPIVDNGRSYSNVFDANYDTLVWSLEKNGFGNMSIIIGEIGWPTDGYVNANPANAQRFNQGFINHVSTGKGTPMRPSGPIDAYLFSLIDEDAKSIQPGYFERHWGIFNFDGTIKYQLNLGLTESGTLFPARGVRYLGKKWCIMSPSANLGDYQLAPSLSYACARADCTSLGPGSSCANLNAIGNVSYAYNSYYQQQNQLDSACMFPDNLSVITTQDPSKGTCRFVVQIVSETASPGSGASSGRFDFVRTFSTFLLSGFIIVILAL